ncbi:MAG: signal peptidase II [Clostridiales Family XIII bacterium]|jgi:signal peptidase II|nr:signal peptidase II [Clostridiales Family XIII bacterium]
MYFIAIAAAVALDQMIKSAVRSHIAYSVNGQSAYPVIDGFFYITNYHNTGAAFNFMEDHTALLLVITAGVLASLLAFLILRRKTEHRLLLWGVSLIVAGGVGNMVDRVRWGYVLDYVHLYFFPFIFNFADVAVCTGCGVVLLYLILSERKDGGKLPDE